LKWWRKEGAWGGGGGKKEKRRKKEGFWGVEKKGERGKNFENPKKKIWKFWRGGGRRGGGGGGGERKGKVKNRR